MTWEISPIKARYSTVLISNIVIGLRVCPEPTTTDHHYNSIYVSCNKYGSNRLTLKVKASHSF